MKWFTSDLHIGHKNIIKYCDRPYTDVADMRLGLVKNFCEVIEPGDELYILGDLCFDSLETRTFLQAVPGAKFMVWGNHDPKRSERKRLEGAFVKTAELMEIKLSNGEKTVLCHYPMYRWNRSHHGSYHLHGHTHGNLKYPQPMRALDVGVDSWLPNVLPHRKMYPWSEKEIIEYMECMPIPPHHYDERE